MNPEKLKKWNRWIGDANKKGTITNELANLAIIRKVHSGLIKMVDENKTLQIHSAFYSVSHATYFRTVLMYIRRQVRKDQDSIGLIMLSEDICKNSELITKEFHSNLYIRNGTSEEDIKGMRRLGEKNFDSYFGGETINSLDPNIIKQDIEKLSNIYSDSSEFIDWRLAHLDKREPSRMPVITEIENWCDSLNTILRKYILLLQATDYKVEPILEHDWRDVFRNARL